MAKDISHGIFLILYRHLKQNDKGQENNLTFRTAASAQLFWPEFQSLHVGSSTIVHDRKRRNWYSITPEATRTLSLLDIVLHIITHIPCFIVLHFIALHRYYVFFFSLPIEGLWQPCNKQVCRHHFPNSIGSLHVSVSHFGNSHNILDIFIMVYLLW